MEQLQNAGRWWEGLPHASHSARNNWWEKLPTIERTVYKVLYRVPPGMMLISPCCPVDMTLTYTLNRRIQNDGTLLYAWADQESAVSYWMNYMDDRQCSVYRALAEVVLLSPTVHLKGGSKEAWACGSIWYDQYAPGSVLWCKWIELKEEWKDETAKLPIRR